MTRVAGRCRNRRWKKPELVNVNITSFAYDYVAEAEAKSINGNTDLPFHDKLNHIILIL